MPNTSKGENNKAQYQMGSSKLFVVFICLFGSHSAEVRIILLGLCSEVTPSGVQGTLNGVRD